MYCIYLATVIWNMFWVYDNYLCMIHSNIYTQIWMQYYMIGTYGCAVVVSLVLFTNNHEIFEEHGYFLI